MINQKTKYPIALDIGNRAIHAVQLKHLKGAAEVSGLYRNDYTSTCIKPQRTP